MPKKTNRRISTRAYSESLAGITELTQDVLAGPGKGPQAATIPAKTITYAKIQDVSASPKLLGRHTSGAGSVEEIGVGAGLAMSGSDLIAAAGGVGLALPLTCEGRLTTESGVPVSSSDRTAQSTLYFTPSTKFGLAITNGNLTLYDGAQLVNIPFTQLSLALSGLTSGKNYDVFVDHNSGTPQLVLSAAWASDATRTDALGVQNGIVVKSGTPTYRWVGTIRTTGTTTTEDSVAKRYVWNAENRVARILFTSDATQHSYNSTTWRAWNNTASNKTEFVVGAADLPVLVHIFSGQDSSGPTGQVVAALNWTTGTPAGPVSAFAQSTTSYASHADCRPAIGALGYNSITVVEAGGGSGTQTFYNYTTASVVQG